MSIRNECAAMCKKIASMLRAFVRLALAFIAGGRECTVCGAPCGALMLCRHCKKQIMDNASAALPSAIPSFQRCSVCGKMLVSEVGVCMRCRDSNTRVLNSTSRVLPIFSYRLWMRPLLIAWKDEGEMALSPFFAKQMAMAIKCLGGGVVVPVPPRPGKMRKKGYDQIADLLKYLDSDKKQSHFMILKLLYRTTSIEQKSLSLDKRLAMIDSGAYRVKEGKELIRALRPAGGVMPERVCLIDDVSTTGATLESCAAALHTAGVKEVDAVTLFTVD